MQQIWIVGNGLIIISSIICMSYLYQFDWRNPKSRWPLLSVLIIGITILITGLQFIFPEILSLFRRNYQGLMAGEWWRMITPLFVQPQGWMQCFSNAFFLLAFVPLAERLYGKGLLALYFIPGIAGQIVNYLWSPDGGGSSTAAFGVMGGLFVYIIRHRSLIPRFYISIAIAAFCAAAVLGFFRDGHGPALLVGACVATILRTQLPGLKK